jgi:hypothetical protein
MLKGKDQTKLSLVRNDNDDYDFLVSFQCKPSHRSGDVQRTYAMRSLEEMVHLMGCELYLNYTKHLVPQRYTYLLRKIQAEKPFNKQNGHLLDGFAIRHLSRLPEVSSQSPNQIILLAFPQSKFS